MLGVELLVVLVLLVVVDRFCFRASAAYVELARMFGTHGAQRQHPFELLAAALRTRRNVAFTHQLFEGFLAFSTGVFVNRHRACKDNVYFRNFIP